MTTKAATTNLVFFSFIYGVELIGVGTSVDVCVEEISLIDEDVCRAHGVVSAVDAPHDPIHHSVEVVP